MAANVLHLWVRDYFHDLEAEPQLMDMLSQAESIFEQKEMTVV